MRSDFGADFLVLFVRIMNVSLCRELLWKVKLVKIRSEADTDTIQNKRTLETGQFTSSRSIEGRPNALSRSLHTIVMI